MTTEKNNVKISQTAESLVKEVEVHIDLSIVIIGRNEALRLEKAIESAILAGNLTEKIYEIIYVDSASTDNSTSIAERYPISVIKIEPKQWVCAAAGRTIGFRFSRGDHIAFLDGDMICDPLWFSHALTIFSKSNRKIGGVVGNRTDIDILSGSPIGSREFKSGVVDIINIGGASVMSRKALSKSGGFDPYLISFEERELAQRITNVGFSIIGVPHAMVCHYRLKSGIAEILRRGNAGYRIGYGQYIKRLLIRGRIGIALRETKVQIAFWICVMGFVAIVSVAVLRKSSWMALLAITTVPIAVMIFVIRLKQFTQGIIYFITQPLITKGLIQGLFRPIPREIYNPKLSWVRRGITLPILVPIEESMLSKTAK